LAGDGPAVADAARWGGFVMHKPLLIGVAALCAHAALTSSWSTSAAADAPKRRSIANCTSFDQHAKSELSLELTVQNKCTMPIDCTVSWRLVCAPGSKKRRKVTPSSISFTLATETAQSTEANATECGDDSWEIQAVSWRCQPNKE
jgi:hypothetical protein